MAHITVKGVGSSQLIQRDISTYRSVNAYLLNKRFYTELDEIDRITSLIWQINLMTNIKALENRGVVTRNNALGDGINPDTVFNHIFNNVDDTILRLIKYFRFDYYDKEIPIKDLNIVSFLSEQQEYDATNVQNEIIEQFYIDDSVTTSAKISIGTYTVNNNVYTPIIIDGRISNDVNSNDEPIIKMVNIDDENDIIEILWDGRDYEAYACYYEYNDPNTNNNNHYVTTIYVFKKDIEVSIEENNNIVIIPIKLAGNGVEDKYSFILNKLGIKRSLEEDTDPDNEEDLYDTYNNDNIKNMLITYASPIKKNIVTSDGQEIPIYDSKLFEAFVRYTYGEVGARKYVEINFTLPNSTNRLKITYGYGVYKNDEGEKETAYGINMMLVDENDNELDQYGFTPIHQFYEQGMPFFIISLDALNSLPLLQKYDAYDATLSMFLSITKRIKLKWYQTWWGQILIGAVLGMFAGNPFWVALLESAVTHLILKITPPSLKPIVAFMLQLGVNLLHGNKNAIMNLIKSPQLYFQFSKLYLQYLANKDIQELQQELKNLKEEDREAQEELLKKARFSTDPYSDTHNTMESYYNSDDIVWNSTNIEFATISSADNFYENYDKGLI